MSIGKILSIIFFSLLALGCGMGSEPQRAEQIKELASPGQFNSSGKEPQETFDALCGFAEFLNKSVERECRGEPQVCVTRSSSAVLAIPLEASALEFARDSFSGPDLARISERAYEVVKKANSLGVSGFFIGEHSDNHNRSVFFDNGPEGVALYCQTYRKSEG